VRVEPAEYIVEHAVHLAMQRKKWMDVGATLEADLAAPAVPGNEILDGHGVLLLQSSDFRRGQTAAEVGLVI
jgi:hypothetical protein